MEIEMALGQSGGECGAMIGDRFVGWPNIAGMEENFVGIGTKYTISNIVYLHIKD